MRCEPRSHSVGAIPLEAATEAAAATAEAAAAAAAVVAQCQGELPGLPESGEWDGMYIARML